MWEQEVREMEEEDARRDAVFLPRQDCPPIKRDHFLKRVLPQCQGRTAELARIAKAYVRWDLTRRLGETPTEIEISEGYAKWPDMNSFQEANEQALFFKYWHRGVFLKASKRRARPTPKTSPQKKLTKKTFGS